MWTHNTIRKNQQGIKSDIGCGTMTDKVMTAWGWCWVLFFFVFVCFAAGFFAILLHSLYLESITVCPNCPVCDCVAVTSNQTVSSCSIMTSCINNECETVSTCGDK